VSSQWLSGWRSAGKLLVPLPLGGAGLLALAGLAARVTGLKMGRGWSRIAAHGLFSLAGVRPAHRWLSGKAGFPQGARLLFAATARRPVQ